MKHYQAPELCFVLFHEEDIVRTSGQTGETDMEKQSYISGWFGN